MSQRNHPTLLQISVSVCGLGIIWIPHRFMSVPVPLVPILRHCWYVSFKGDNKHRRTLGGTCHNIRTNRDNGRARAYSLLLGSVLRSLSEINLKNTPSPRRLFTLVVHKNPSRSGWTLPASASTKITILPQWSRETQMFFFDGWH